MLHPLLWLRSLADSAYEVLQIAQLFVESLQLLLLALLPLG